MPPIQFLEHPRHRQQQHLRLQNKLTIESTNTNHKTVFNSQWTDLNRPWNSAYRVSIQASLARTTPQPPGPVSIAWISYRCRSLSLCSCYQCCTNSTSCCFSGAGCKRNSLSWRTLRSRGRRSIEVVCCRCPWFESIVRGIVVRWLDFRHCRGKSVVRAACVLLRRCRMISVVVDRFRPECIFFCFICIQWFSNLKLTKMILIRWKNK